MICHIPQYSTPYLWKDIFTMISKIIVYVHLPDCFSSFKVSSNDSDIPTRNVKLSIFLLDKLLIKQVL